MISDSYSVNNNIAVKSLCEIDALESIVHMIQRDMGVSLLPIWKGLEDVASNIKILAIPEKKYQRHISAISHRQAGKEPLIKIFSEALFRESK